MLEIKISNIYLGVGLGISWHEYKDNKNVFILLPFVVLEIVYKP